MVLWMSFLSNAFPKTLFEIILFKNPTWWQQWFWSDQIGILIYNGSNWTWTNALKLFIVVPLLRFYGFTIANNILCNILFTISLSRYHEWKEQCRWRVVKINPICNRNIWIWRSNLKDIRVVQMWWSLKHMFYVNSLLNNPFTIYYYQGNTNWKINHSGCFRLVFQFRTFIWQLMSQDCINNMNVKEPEMGATRKVEVVDCDVHLQWKCFFEEFRVIHLWWFYSWTFFAIQFLNINIQIYC